MAKRSTPRKGDPTLIMNALGTAFGLPAGVGQALMKGPQDRARAVEHRRNEKAAEQTRKRLSGRSR